MRAATDVRVLHTFVFDGDEARDFIRGVGLRFDVPIERTHCMIAMFASPARMTACSVKAVRGLTGLRRDPGDECSRGAGRGTAAGHDCARRRASRTRTDSRIRRLDVAAAECGFVSSAQANCGGPCVAGFGSRPSRGRAGLYRRASGRRGVRHSQFLAEPSGAARHSRAPSASVRRSRCGCGRRMRRRWTCASITMVWARTPMTNKSKV